MPATLLMAVKDLRQRLRDRSFFIFGLIVPFVLTFIFNLLLGPLTSETPFTPKLGLVDEDGTPFSAGMRTALTAAADQGVISWVTVGTLVQARSQVDDDEVDAAIVVPAGFGSALLTDAPLDLMVLGDPDGSFAAQVAESIAAAYVSRLRSAIWANAALAQAGEAAVPGILFAQVAGASDALSLRTEPTSLRQLEPTTYYAVGMAVFFVFFIVQLGVTGLLDEERDGTLFRLLAAPTGRRSILLGKVISSMVIGVVSMVTLALASTLVMGADWGPSLPVLLLIVAVVAAAAGILMLVAGVARSAEAAGNVQAIVAITLGSLGGVFFQLPQQEGVLQWLQRASPHFWFMQGVGDLAGGGGVGVLGNELLALLVFTLVAGSIGWAALERRLNR